MKHYRFSQLDPIIYYDKVLSNFIHNFNIESLNNVELIEYKLKDYDTPENVCYRLYGDSSLSWILLYLNDKIDPFYEWPLNTNELKKYIIGKYGINHLDDIHHWELNGKVVNRCDNAIPITNENYETRLNDEKRNILIPTIDTVSAFINNMELYNE